METVNRLASRNPVVIFSHSTCCMSYTVKRLFSELGVNADVHELDENPKGREMERALAKLMEGSSPVPAVFIGGTMIGSTDRVMALHLRGDLVQLLRQAGALWL